jgi:hypothetical protein
LKHIAKNHLSNIYIAFFIGLFTSNALAQIKDDALSPDVVAISNHLAREIQLSDSERQWIDANHKIRF